MFPPGRYLPTMIGYCTLFNVPSCPRKNGRRLQFQCDTFDDFLLQSEPDVYGVLNHDSREVKFAGPAGILLDADSHGLLCVILPVNNSEGRIATSLVLGGHAAAMSIDVRYSRSLVIPRGNVDTVRHAAIAEVTATRDPAIPGTVLRVVDREMEGIPRTIQELRVLRKKLLQDNVRYWNRSSADEWKRDKAARRAALLAQLEPLAAAF